MHQIDDAIVHGGKIMLSGLPFADGQRVRIVLAEVDAESSNNASIEDVRRILKGGVERFDNPFESLIPADHWEHYLHTLVHEGE
jgi:hypothetical protein